MGNEELIVKLQDLFPGASVIQGNDWPEISFESGADFLSTIYVLKSDQTLAFDYLFCETCVDWKTHFTMVYHLDSTRFRHNIVLKYKLDREAPEIDSLSFIYRTSEQHEREIFDLFGIIFKGHPNLKRILLTEDWVGYPLRKDYDDPINMIKL